MFVTASNGAPAPLILTPEQARILYDLVQLNGALIEARYSRGIWYGLLDALVWIEAAGGAYVDILRTPLSPPRIGGFPTPTTPPI